MGDCDSVNGRANANGFDLNRNFADLFECNNVPLQIETKNVKNWLENNNFILSANFHSGSVVANYPYDNYHGGASSGINLPSITDDDSLFIKLAEAYSLNHQTMKNNPCTIDNFSNGVTNGAEWYPIIGGMQGM
jgi:hypothetical protein